MYKLVFLLVFSAANVTGLSGATCITLDIDIKSDTETSCQVTPAGTQTLTEDEDIQFHIETPTKLVNFWCNNHRGTLVYHPKITKPTKYYRKMEYVLPKTSIDSKYDMTETWNCTFQILNEESTVSRRESTCLFQVTVTDKPDISLNVAQLSRWTWKNKTKQYNYTFTEGEKTFGCILDNPTENEERYTVSFKLDGVQQKRFPNVTIKPHNNTTFTDNFKLNKDSKLIVCTATNVKGKGADLQNDIYLQYIPQLTFYVTGSSELKEDIFYWNSVTQIYSYNFTADTNITVTGILDIDEGSKDKYEIVFYLDETKYDGRVPRVQSHGKSSKKLTLTLNENNKNITCVVRDKKTKKIVQTRTVKLKHKKRKSASGVELTIEGLPENKCYPTDNLHLNKICNYTYGESAHIESKLPLKCVLTRTQDSAKPKVVFEMKFGTNEKNVSFNAGDLSPKNVLYEIPLTEGINTAICTATKDASTADKMTITVKVYVPPRTTTSTTTTEPTTSDDPSIRWVKWVLGGGALLITICVVVGCIVMHRQKKTPPADSTYANLTKDKKSTPVPASRTTQKPNEPNAGRKRNVALDNNYSEPQEPQDMSEALYADPNRFLGESSNYAEPYVAKPNPQSDMYAEPYKSNYAEPYPSSEGNYAELNPPDSSGKELYAKPIPKAIRKPKVKDDCNYSNVFSAHYGNTRK